MSSTASSGGGSSSSTESSRRSSPRVHRGGKQSNSRASRSEYAAFKALLRRSAPSQSRIRIPPKSRSVSRRPSTLVESSVAPSSDSDSVSNDDDDLTWPSKAHLDLTIEPRLDDLVKTFAGEYVRRQGLKLPEVQVDSPSASDGEAAQGDEPDPELLSTLSTNVISQLNRTLVNLASGHRLRQSERALTGYDVLRAHALSSIPETNSAIDAMSVIVDQEKLKLHAHRLNVLRDALNARPLPPRAAFYASTTLRQDRKTAKYLERARKRNKRARTTTAVDS